MPSLFDDFITRDLFTWPSQLRSGGTLPAVNIKETNDHYALEVAAPGMQKKDFNVELDNNLLVISAHSNSEHEAKEGHYSRREFNYTDFKRTFTLPEHMVNGDKIVARYTDGVLHVQLPKTEEAKTKPPRQIQIA
jgi:HSP20 family protein